MKISTALAACALPLSLVTPAAASPYSREFNRGYYDCLDGQFDQDRQSHPYREGCRAAEREREGDEEPPPGRPQPPWAGGGGEPGWGSNGGGPPAVPGPARPVGVPNVRGMQPAQVLAAMASYGYRNVGTTVVGGAIFGIYFNPATRECVQVANANGRAVDAREIGSNPRCR